MPPRPLRSLGYLVFAAELRKTYSIYVWKYCTKIGKRMENPLAIESQILLDVLLWRCSAGICFVVPNGIHQHAEPGSAFGFGVPEIFLTAVLRPTRRIGLDFFWIFDSTSYAITTLAALAFSGARARKSWKCVAYQPSWATNHPMFDLSQWSSCLPASCLSVLVVVSPSAVSRLRWLRFG